MRGETDSIGNFQDAGKGTRCREHGEPCLDPQHLWKHQDPVAHICNPSTGDREAELCLV